MKKILTISALCFSLISLSVDAHKGHHAKKITKKAVVKNYIEIVFENYEDAYEDALKLQKSIDKFLAKPSERNLKKAKKAWLVSRDSYGQTEAFRFYEGPIDFVNNDTGEEGPEGRLNAWPLNEAYIDYVQGNVKAGIVQDKNVVITKEALSAKNQENDEADVATGYHAIEFLLWGQDLSLDGPGQRPAADYENNEENKRRRAYLKAVTDLLVDDLKFLVDSWKPGENNYAKEFVKDDEKALEKILTSLATLSGFEIASERLATALDSGDQEDEHSCFSDNTHKDFVMNARGITNVFFGEYEDHRGASIYSLLKKKDKGLAIKLKEQLLETEKLISRIPNPVDRELLATEKGSDARINAEKAVASLQKQADLFKEVGKALGLDVQILD